MIEQYWDEVFVKFKTQTGKFEIPCFPEPLMSAHFGVINVLGSHAGGKRFWLCEFDTINSRAKHISSEKLQHVGDDFWRFQAECNSSAFPFIQRLVPFLNLLETPHFHLFLKDEKGIYASTIAGEGKCGVFLFNLIVREDRRGQGIAKLMTNEARSYFSGKKCFYWTIHQGFFLGSKVSEYGLKGGGQLLST